jgi:hypothetical protein
MANVATGIILIAGTTTFATEWYNTKKVNFKIPVATLFAAAIFDGFAKLDSKAATGIAVIVLLGALTTKWGGKSAMETLASTTTKVTKKPTTVKKVA